MTQEELAKILNVDRSTVAKWETTDAFPRTGKMLEISNLFKCKVDFLLCSKSEETAQGKTRKREVKEVKRCSSYLEQMEARKA